MAQTSADFLTGCFVFITYLQLWPGNVDYVVLYVSPTRIQLLVQSIECLLFEYDSWEFRQRLTWWCDQKYWVLQVARVIVFVVCSTFGPTCISMSVRLG